MDARRRLAQLATHLVSRATTTAPTGAGVIAPPAEMAGSVLPVKLHSGLVDGQLSPLPEALDALRAAMRESAEVGDYRRAVALQDALAVAEPRPLLPASACAPATPDGAFDFFAENGFVVVEQLFDPAQLQRLQASWRRAQAPARALWHEAKEFGEGQWERNGLYYKNLPPGHDVERFKKLPHGRLFFDIPVVDFFSEACQQDGDPVLLDLIAPPKLMPVLEKIVGPDVRLVGVQPRTVPPEREGGYTSW